MSHEAKEALRKFDELAGNTLNQAGKNDGAKEKPEKEEKGFMDKVLKKPLMIKFIRASSRCVRKMNHPLNSLSSHTTCNGGRRLKNARAKRSRMPCRCTV